MRAKGVTDPAGPGRKDVGTCLAVCAHNKAGGGEAGTCALGDNTAGIELDAKNPAVLLPIKAYLTTCEEHWGVNHAAID